MRKLILGVFSLVVLAGLFTVSANSQFTPQAEKGIVTNSVDANIIK